MNDPTQLAPIPLHQKREPILNISEAQTTLRILKLLPEALRRGFNQTYKACENSPNVKNIYLNWNVAILKALLDRKNHASLEVESGESGDSCINIDEIDGSTTISFYSEEVVLTGISLNTILQQLLNEILLIPGYYTPELIQLTLNHAFITNRAKPSQLTELAVEYVRNHLTEVSSDHKIVTARYMLNNFDAHEYYAHFNVAESLIFDTNKLDSLSTEDRVNAIFEHPENFPCETVWGGILYCILKENIEPDSDLFKAAVRLILDEEINCPTRLASEAALKFIQRNASEKVGNEGFFVIPAKSRAVQDYFVKQRKTDLLREYSNNLKTALEADCAVYGFNQNWVITSEEKSWYSRSVCALWLDGRTKLALTTGKKQRDLALFILRNMEHRAILEWNSRLSKSVKGHTIEDGFKLQSN